jgi:hypothetical protein
MNNQLFVIAPYWSEEIQTWAFDDRAVGLIREPFVSGVPEMIEDLVRDIPNARSGFRMFFSTQSFPGFQRRVQWVREEMGGNWYRSEQPPMELFVKA